MAFCHRGGCFVLGGLKGHQLDFMRQAPPLGAFNLKRYVVAAGGCQLHGRALSIRFLHVTFPPRREALRRSFPLLVASVQVTLEMASGMRLH